LHQHVANAQLRRDFLLIFAEHVSERDGRVEVGARDFPEEHGEDPKAGEEHTRLFASLDKEEGKYCGSDKFVHQFGGGVLDH